MIDFSKIPGQAFDTESDFGIDYGGVPSYDYGDFGSFDPERINDLTYGRYSPMSSGNSLDKIFEALNKANTYKAQSGSAPSFKGIGQGTNVEKVGNSTYIINRAPKQKVTGGSSGGGLGSAIGGIAGTALSFIPGVGPVAQALLPKVGSTVGGLFG